MTDRVFHIKWDTGFMDVKISTFFVEANVSKVKKLCKLARQHCTEEERLSLLDALSQEDKERKDLLDALNELARKKGQSGEQFLPYIPHARARLGRKAARKRSRTAG